MEAHPSIARDRSKIVLDSENQVRHWTRHFYRGLHEAVVNHANNKPEIITCAHEDIAVHLAQGYAKIAGKPMAMACHGVVGLQHAAMAIYNAWCDRVPVCVPKTSSVLIW